MDTGARIDSAICDVNLNDIGFWAGDWETWQCVALEDGTWLALSPTSSRVKNLDGIALVEEWDGLVLPDGGGQQPRRAVSIRTYDVNAGLWHIYWIDPLTGHFLPQFVGKFWGAHGEFFASSWERLACRMVSADALRWEYAICEAGVWNPVWVMEMSRETDDYRTPSSATFVAPSASPSASTHSSM